MLLLSLARLYIRRSPIERGKGRLAAACLPRLGQPPESVVRMRDGRRFVTDLRNGLSDQLIFGIEQEPGVSAVVRAIVNRGDACIDVGANYGWFTTLFAVLAGPDGRVMAFEPHPASEALLRRNVSLLGAAAHVEVLSAAVGDGARETSDLFLQPGRNAAYASLCRQHDSAVVVASTRVETLNAAARRAGRPIAVVKVDAEGSEHDILSGASELLAQEAPPIWIVEMARETLEPFGHHPNELLAVFARHGGYDCFGIDDRRGTLIALGSAGFGDDDAGANVLCVPRARHDRIASLAQRPVRAGDFSFASYGR